MDENFVTEVDILENGIHHFSTEKQYVPPKEPVLQEKLAWFQDQKLAIMMHWGIYSQPGIVESWALIDEDEEWSRNEIDWTDDVDAFKDEYVALNKTFNPIRFEPDKWARIAKETGFRYLIFTTKHHDGFCMWDTQQTDYKVTAPDCPFHIHPKANIVKHVFDAFRAEGLGIAAYFSKADWHTPYYWKEGALHGFTTRNVSYEPKADPETWEKFVQFTHNQLMELADDYGPLDILWFDAGWVRPSNGQDARIGEIMDKIREKHPDILSADRTVGGPYENYVTPEQCVPEEPMFVPWESCITLSHAFSYRYDCPYKTPREVIGLLLQVVAKGGNLALNVAPQPDGRLPERAIAILQEFGQWMHAHGEGIYATRPYAPYAKDGFYFTRNRLTEDVYAFRYYEEEADLPEKVFRIPFGETAEQITCLETGETLSFSQEDGALVIQSPDLNKLSNDAPLYTLTFKISPAPHRD